MELFEALWVRLAATMVLFVVIARASERGREGWLSLTVAIQLRLGLRVMICEPSMDRQGVVLGGILRAIVCVVGGLV